MPKALISIDYTVDFVADGGKLTAGAPAQAISEAIAQVTKAAFDRGDYIFLLLMLMMKMMPFTQKASFFRPTISRERAVAIFTDPWRIFMRSTKRTPESFGWISVIILLFLAQI